MGHQSMCRRRARWVFILLAASASACGAALAGSAEYEQQMLQHSDDPDDGPPFFGEAKDLRTMGPLAGVRVKAAVQGTSVAVVVATDIDGRFRLPGLGRGVGPDTVVFSCAKDGYAPADAMTRATGSTPNAPIEVECLMDRK